MREDSPCLDGGDWVWGGSEVRSVSPVGGEGRRGTGLARRMMCLAFGVASRVGSVGLFCGCVFWEGRTELTIVEMQQEKGFILVPGSKGSSPSSW